MEPLEDIVKKQSYGKQIAEYFDLVGQWTSPVYLVGRQLFKRLKKKGSDSRMALIYGFFGAVITSHLSAAIYAKTGFLDKVYDENNVAIYGNVVDTNNMGDGMFSFFSPYHGLATLLLSGGFKVRNKENYVTCFYYSENLKINEKFDSVEHVRVGRPFKITIRGEGKLEEDELETDEEKALFVKRAKNCEELVEYSFTSTFSPYFPTTVRGAKDMYIRNVSFSAFITAVEPWDEATLKEYPHAKGNYNRLTLVESSQSSILTCDAYYKGWIA